MSDKWYERLTDYFQSGDWIIPVGYVCMAFLTTMAILVCIGVVA